MPAAYKIVKPNRPRLRQNGIVAGDGLLSGKDSPAWLPGAEFAG